MLHYIHIILLGTLIGSPFSWSICHDVITGYVQRYKKEQQQKKEGMFCGGGELGPIILLNRSTFIHHHLCLLYNRDARDSFPEFNRMDPTRELSIVYYYNVSSSKKRGLRLCILWCWDPCWKSVYSRLLLCIHIEKTEYRDVGRRDRYMQSEERRSRVKCSPLLGFSICICMTGKFD